MFLVTAISTFRGIIRDGQRAGQQQTEILSGLIEDKHDHDPVRTAKDEAIEETGGNDFVRDIVEKQHVTTYGTNYKGRSCTLVVYMADVTQQQINDLEKYKPVRTFQHHGKTFTNTETTDIVVKEVISCMYGNKAPYLFNPHRKTLMDMFATLSGVKISDIQTARTAVNLFCMKFGMLPKKQSIASRMTQMSLNDDDEKMESSSQKLGDVIVKYANNNFRLYHGVTVRNGKWYDERGDCKGDVVVQDQGGKLSLIRNTGLARDSRPVPARVLNTITVTYHNNNRRVYTGAVFDKIWVAHRGDAIEIMGDAKQISNDRYVVTRDSGNHWDIGKWYTMELS